MPRTTHRPVLRAGAPNAARLLVVLTLAATVLATALAPSYAADRHRPHHPRHHPHHRAHHVHPDGRVARAMSIAVAQRGKPYVYGASGPGAFDCSGLTSYAFHRAGFRAVPRTAA